MFVVLLAMLAATGYLTAWYHDAEQARGIRHAARAETLALEGDFNGAIDQYREALTYARDNVDYRLALAVTLLETSRRGEAESYFAELLAADPTLAVPNLHLARLAEERDDLNLATTRYRTAIYGRWPDDPVRRRIETWFEFVSVLERRGETGQAAAELNELLGDTPNNPTVANRVAWSLLGVGAPAAALDVFEGLIEEAPDDAVAHSGVAEAEFAQHRYLTARTHFRRALALNPRLTHLNPRLALTDRIIALDPTIRGLGRVSRYERSLEMLARAIGELDGCVYPDGEDIGPIETIPPEAADELATAREWTEGTLRRPQDDDSTEQNILLTERLWRARAAACPQLPPSDEPLARVLGKIESSALE